MLIMKKKLILSYENKSEPLLPGRQFALRMLEHFGAGASLILISLGMGVLGYHLLENMSWLDALLNASMILGGMGPVNTLVTTAGKVFASIYALFSGVIFLAAAGVMVAPMVHRILHRLHLDENDPQNG
jgi:hypothetical protein